MSVFLSKKLEYFMVTMEKKCIIKAAESLCITRTPLCKMISEFENLLGCKLFIRNYNELQPTSQAIDLYHSILPIYEHCKKTEKHFIPKKTRKEIVILIDVSFPELLFRYIAGVLANAFKYIHFSTKRVVVNENLLSEHENNSNAIFLTLREFKPISGYKHLSWQREGVALITSDKTDTSAMMNVYVWGDKYTSFVEDSIKKIFQRQSESIQFIRHSMELTTVMHNIYHGYGAMVMPLKLALIYKCDKLKIIPNFNKKLYISAYHNLDDSLHNCFSLFKKTIDTII